MLIALGLPGRAPSLYLYGAQRTARGLQAPGYTVRYALPRARFLRVMTKTKSGWTVLRGAEKFKAPRCGVPGHFLNTPIELPKRQENP